ncbi:MAG: PKD domain-containing protein [Flavobacteriales bacterium]|nr:PKD domain-containing protein [Flavobacteriales bacterium]
MRCFKYIILSACLLVGSLNIKAQVDTVFWFAAPWVTPDHAGNQPMAFHFSTFANATTIRLRQPASVYDTSFTVAPNTLFTKYVSHLLDSLESKPADSVINRGFEVSSDFPIVAVYDFQSTGNNPETYSLKGQNGMGYEFVTPFQTLWNNKYLGPGRIQPYQFFSVVATENNTTIHITPRCDVVGGHPANVTYSVFLPNAGQVYTCQNITQITSTLGSNLAGSVITSDKKISVTVNDDSVNPSGGGGCYDLLGDQIVPTDVIGKEYIVNKGFLNAGSDESAFIVATENFTALTIDNGVVVTNTIINQGDTYQYSITEQLTSISSDKNVYVLHMSGYGCELGEALLPPLNCAGSDQVSYARSNGFSFLLDILCPAGAEGNFTMDGDPTAIQATDFNSVPGTGGAWMGAQIPFSIAEVPVGSAPLVVNSTDLFSLGVINGSATGGCLYHYLSQFNRKVFTQAGSDTTYCTGDFPIDLNGSITGGTTTGSWQILNGTGTLNNPTNLVTTYEPTVSDFAQGTLTFVLGSSGNCDPIFDTVVVSFVTSPDVTAGIDDTYCKNNIGSIPIEGTLQFAAGSDWSGGSGGAFGNVGDLITTYTPSPADLAADSVELYLTSAGSFFACPNDEDTLVIHFTDPPSVLAGASQVVCASTDSVFLAGSVAGASITGVWTTSGSGAFTPSDSDLNAAYLITPGDTTAGSITFTLSSTGNGSCLAVQDSLTVTILDRPQIEITTADSVCANVATIDLTGTVTTGFSIIWNVYGSGGIALPTALSTTYIISPIDTAAGFVDVVLATSGGICPTEEDSMRVFFVEPPRVNAGIDQDFCANEPVQLNGALTGSALGANWTSTGTGSFSPGSAFLTTFYNPSSSDVALGTINLVLTSSADFGCLADDDTLMVTFKPAPVAEFTATQSCFGENTDFTDLSTTSDGTINSWSYDFGDTATSIASTPAHNYPGAGTYMTTLIVSSTNGCYDTTVHAVIVDPIPLAAFNVNTICEGDVAQFTDASFISSGSIVGWTWDFNSGAGLSTDQDAEFIFPASGSYPVHLIAISDLGCSGEVITNIDVLEGPLADFTVAPNPALALEDVYFYDQSTNGPIVDWYWDFGDDIGGNNQNEVHDYANGGSYEVILMVTDLNACTDSIAQTIHISLLPVLPTAFTPNGDGENDVFLIRGGPFDAVEFNIYNNWGQLIFQSFDPELGWDGKFNTQDAPLGVYTWTFTVQLAGGRVIVKEGDVTLMR